MRHRLYSRPPIACDGRLALLVAVCRAVLVELLEQYRIDPDPAPLREDPEEHEPDAGDAPAHPHEPRDTHQVGVAVPLPARAQRPVRVGDGAEHGHGLSVDVGEAHQPRVDDRLERLGERLSLFVGLRQEAPVRGPRLVIELQDQLHLAGEVLHVDRARGDVRALAHRCRQPLDPFLRHVVELAHVGDVVLHLRQAVALKQLAVVGRIVGEFHRGVVLESLDQDGLTLVRGVGILAGAAHRGHAALLQPRAGGVEQRRDDLGVVLHLEEPEEADLGTVVLVEAAIHGGGDASDDAVTALGEEVRDLRAAVVGVLRGQQALCLEQPAAEQVHRERRGPVGVAPVQAPRQHRELADAVVPEPELLDRYRCVAHGRILPAAPTHEG
jgi:hypothetical protein